MPNRASRDSLIDAVLQKIETAKTAKSAGSAAWGVRMADLLVELHDLYRSKSYALPLFVANAALLAIVRKKKEIDPRWDVLVFCAQDPSPAQRAEFVEILRAIPDPRRSKVMIAWFKRTWTPSALALTESTLLPELGSPLLAKHAGRAVEKEAAKKQAAPKKVAKLSLASDRWPKKLDDLTPKQRKQLEVMGEGHDGKRLSAAKRFGTGPDAHASSLRIREVKDANGKVVYEAFTWLADDGCVFVAGTLEEIAQVVQSGVECKDAALRAALSKVLK